MCTRRRRLSREEARETRILLEQLRAEGVDLGEDAEIPEVIEEPCPVEITQGTDVCVVHHSGPMTVVYALSLRIVVQRRNTLMDCYIVTPWGERIDLAYLKKENERYRAGPLSFRSQEVLNDRFANPLRVSQGAVLDGTIVGYGGMPIPQEFTQRVLPAQVVIEDSSGREAHGKVFLAVERLTKGSGTSPRRPEIAGIRQPNSGSECPSTAYSDSAHTGAFANDGGSVLGKRRSSIYD